MKLHENIDDFNHLISIVAKNKNLSETAVIRDYYIVILLHNLERSEYKDKCVFKGGTSLSKCYPNSIERFSEDIDLTFLEMSFDDNHCERELKKIEEAMTINANTKKIGEERNKRNKSMYVWFDSEENKIKLEIGCSVKPEPYSYKRIKSYIHEYLEKECDFDSIEKYELKEVELNVLNIERTFIDKVMAVKRHAICGRLQEKTRHIYDVVRLFNMKEIKDFLENKSLATKIIKMTKETDHIYLEKRKDCGNYNAMESYNFSSWNNKFDESIRHNYERLHENILFTDDKQDFDLAIKVFESISEIFKTLGE